MRSPESECTGAFFLLTFSVRRAACVRFSQLVYTRAAEERKRSSKRERMRAKNRSELHSRLISLFEGERERERERESAPRDFGANAM